MIRVGPPRLATHAPNGPAADPVAGPRSPAGRAPGTGSATRRPCRIRLHGRGEVTVERLVGARVSQREGLQRRATGPGSMRTRPSAATSRSGMTNAGSPVETTWAGRSPWASPDPRPKAPRSPEASSTGPSWRDGWWSAA